MPQPKIFDIEIQEGDNVYMATDVPAEDKEEALDIAMIMFYGLVDEYSKIIKIEQRTIH
tara:strand:- start:64 stop:240 length:177 start_codon:yes stop_codon:yes gene_type:complete